MTSISTEIIIIAAMLLANGFFALAEIAIVSARKARLRHLADAGNKSAAKALAVVSQPARFLSIVQVGITLVTIVMGVYGGETVAAHLTGWFQKSETLAPVAHKLSLGVVIACLTLLSVVIGELIPKRIALAFPERLAIFATPVINAIGFVVWPVVCFLTAITKLVLRVFGLHKMPKESLVSDEEVNILIEQGMSAGVFNKSEKEMVQGVLELDKLAVTALMTPRPKIIFLNIDDAEEVNWRKIVASGHSYFPVYQSTRDQVLGMVAVKALWAHSAIGLPTHLKNLLLAPLVIPETMMANQLLEAFKKSGKHIALVTDEFGAIQGLVTLIDVMEAIVGDLPAQGSRDVSAVKQREDGSWLIDGTLSLGELKTLLKLKALPHEDEADYQTLAGFMITYFGRIPATADFFEYGGWRFEVVDMDRHRVDKALVSKAKSPAA